MLSTWNERGSLRRPYKFQIGSLWWRNKIGGIVVNVFFIHLFWMSKCSPDLRNLHFKMEKKFICENTWASILNKPLNLLQIDSFVRVENCGCYFLMSRLLQNGTQFTFDRTSTEKRRSRLDCYKFLVRTLTKATVLFHFKFFRGISKWFVFVLIYFFGTFYFKKT